jgi:hypothetical protein
MTADRHRSCPDVDVFAEGIGRSLAQLDVRTRGGKPLPAR